MAMLCRLKNLIVINPNPIETRLCFVCRYYQIALCCFVMSWHVFQVIDEFTLESSNRHCEGCSQPLTDADSVVVRTIVAHDDTSDSRRLLCCWHAGSCWEKFLKQSQIEARKRVFIPPEIVAAESDKGFTQDSLLDARHASKCAIALAYPECNELSVDACMDDNPDVSSLVLRMPVAASKLLPIREQAWKVSDHSGFFQFIHVWTVRAQLQPNQTEMDVYGMCAEIVRNVTNLCPELIVASMAHRLPSDTPNVLVFNLIVRFDARQQKVERSYDGWLKTFIAPGSTYKDKYTWDRLLTSTPPRPATDSLLGLQIEFAVNRWNVLTRGNRATSGEDGINVIFARAVEAIQDSLSRGNGSAWITSTYHELSVNDAREESIVVEERPLPMFVLRVNAQPVEFSGVDSNAKIYYMMSTSGTDLIGFTYDQKRKVPLRRPYIPLIFIDKESVTRDMIFRGFVAVNLDGLRQVLPPTL